MTVDRREAPPFVHENVAEALGVLAPVRRGRRRPRATVPLPLYHADARALLEGAGFDALTAVGWRTIVVDGKAVFFADVEGFEDPRFARRTTGQAVERFLEAAALAEPAEEEAGAYELRIIEAPCLKAAALWLAGEKDRLLPYEGLPTEALTLGEFLTLLTERAVRQRRAYERAEARIRAAKEGGAEAGPTKPEGGSTPPLPNDH